MKTLTKKEMVAQAKENAREEMMKIMITQFGPN